MEYARDLGQVELWEESLRRSLERRNRPRRSSVELHRLRPSRDLTLRDVIERSASYSELRRRAALRPAMPGPSVAIGGISALTLAAAATVPGLLGGGRRQHLAALIANATPASAATPAHTVKPQRAALTSSPPVALPRRRAHPLSPRSSRPVAARPAPDAPSATPPARTTKSPQARVATYATTRQPAATIASVPGTGGAGITTPKRHHKTSTPAPTVKSHHHSGGVGVKVTTSRPTGQTVAPIVASGTYVNPLARARVTPERIDQGVDYSGSGTLVALGAGRVTYSATSGTGWPGAFVEYRLTSGPDSGRYVFYAEGVSPLVHVGQTVQPGQAVAAMSGGIEVGWGAGIGTEAYAMQHGQWSSYDDSHNIPSAAGRDFSALIASLGGPPGRIG